MTNGLEIVREVRATFGPTLTDEQCGLLTNEVAWRLAQTDPAWGVSTKTTGTHATLPNGTQIAHDILHYRTTNTLVDILQAAGAASVPQWVEVPYHHDPARPWLAAMNPSLWQAPLPPPPSPSVQAQLTEMQAQLRQMAFQLDLISHNAEQNALAAQKTQHELERGLAVTLRGNVLSRASGLVQVQR